MENVVAEVQKIIAMIQDFLNKLASIVNQIGPLVVPIIGLVGAHFSAAATPSA